jgi:hypothetical protein
MTRGERNNNPGNIRKSAVKWQGQADAQTDDEFVTFKAPMWGIRALGKILLTYHTKHGCNTVRDLVRRYAPPSENATDAYVHDVATRADVSPDTVIDLRNVILMERLLTAFIHHENGRCTYPHSIIAEAADKALGIA